MGVLNQCGLASCTGRKTPVDLRRYTSMNEEKIRTDAAIGLRSLSCPRRGQGPLAPTESDIDDQTTPVLPRRPPTQGSGRPRMADGRCRLRRVRFRGSDLGPERMACEPRSGPGREGSPSRSRRRKRARCTEAGAWGTATAAKYEGVPQSCSAQDAK